MTNTPDALQFAQLIAELQAEARLKGQFNAEPQTKFTAQGFVDVVVPLSAASLAAGAGGFPLLARGYEISFLRRDSSPGALLKLVGGSGITKAFGPGDYIRGYFESGDIQLELMPGSTNVGNAVFRIALQSQVSFRESPVEVPVQATALLGSISAAGIITYETVLEDVVPTGLPTDAGNLGAFNIAGWRRVLVFVDTLSAAANATSFQINPFYRPPGSDAAAVWFDQGGTELVTIPDSNPSGGRYRTFVLNLSQAQGWFYPGIRNLLAAARTGLGLCVVGVG